MGGSFVLRFKHYLSMKNYLSQLPRGGMLLLVLLLLATGLGGQTFPGNVTFTTQTQLDNFQDEAGKYVRVTGSVTLDGSSTTDVFDDLSNLSELNRVGSLSIRNWSDNTAASSTDDPMAAFTSLEIIDEGLLIGADPNATTNAGIGRISAPNLQTIGNSMTLSNAQTVDTIHFPSLTLIDSSVAIRIMPQLELVSAPLLERIDGFFELFQLGEVTHLDSLGSLGFIDIRLVIADNPLLANINGLGASAIGGRPLYTVDDFVVQDNPQLGNFDDLEVSISVRFVVNDCEFVTNLPDGITLGSAMRDIEILSNQRLTSIAEAFNGTTTITVGTFIVDGNPSLSALGSQPLDVTEGIVFASTQSSVLPNFLSTTSVAQSILIVQNSVLSDLANFANLTSSGGLALLFNPALSDLSGLSSLTTLGNLNLTLNGSITTLEDLQSLTTVNNSVNVTNNNSLGNCCLLPDQVTVAGQPVDGNNDAVTISGNSGDCANKSALTAACLTVAPVELVSFSARRTEAGTVRLEWHTASERDNNHFVVERSSEQGFFEAIGTVVGAGTTQEQQWYVFYDPDTSPTLNYYRLRQVDHDGSHEQSQVVSVAPWEVTDTQLSIFPNPIQRGSLSINWPPTSSLSRWQCTIVDPLGRIMRHLMGDGNSIMLEVNGLPAGTYLARVDTGIRLMQGKFVVID